MLLCFPKLTQLILGEILPELYWILETNEPYLGTEMLTFCVNSEQVN